MVGRIGRAHGIRGDVTVDVRTDDPQERFTPGSVFFRGDEGKGSLVVLTARPYSGKWLLHFRGVDDREGAEALTGSALFVDSDQLPKLSDPDEYYDHELEGLRAFLPDGRALGEVAEVIHGPGGDVLAIERSDRDELLVPFVRNIVPVVDVDQGRVVVDPPPGLVDL